MIIKLAVSRQYIMSLYLETFVLELGQTQWAGPMASGDSALAALSLAAIIILN